MSGQPFTLMPFAWSGPPLALGGTVARSGSRLLLEYMLQGPLEQLCLAPPAATPERRDGLWQTTCLEAFLALPASSAYWEINLSPAGHWNIYRLEAYRQGLTPDPAMTALPFAVTREDDGLRLVVKLELPPALAADQPLALGLAAVIEPQQGALGYWALAHPGPEPDFHHRDGFLLRL
jgi:hypothetical protein